jgi:hypothetical protein
MKQNLRCTACVAIAALSATVAQAKIAIELDYSFDANGFFNPGTTNGQNARASLARAADFYNDRFLENLTAITPNASNTWNANFPNPATGAAASLTNPTIAANVIKVLAGGRSLSGTTLGVGGPGGFSASGFQPFFDTIRGRGQAGAITQPRTDFAPWGGAITFDTDAATNWNYSPSAAPSGSQIDFFSVAIHELGHLMGFGTSDSFAQTLTSGTNFTGAKSKALNGNVNVPLSADLGHFATGLTSTVTGIGTQALVMSPSIGAGQRRLLTLLDWAGFDDLGWDLARPGDANASGTVDFADLVIVAQQYNNSGPQISWSEGDFNYDGVVDFGDLVPLAQNYNLTGPLLTEDGQPIGGSDFAADWALAQSMVPEPATLSAVISGAAMFGRRRRRD